MAEKNDVVLRVSNHRIGTAEWTLSESVQETFRACDAALAKEPEEIQVLLRGGREELISVYTAHLRTFLHLLTGFMLIPPEITETADAILRNAISQAASDMKELLHDQETVTMH